MKIINSFVENVTPQNYSEESICKFIERCGRIAYRSEDKITDDSYKTFCNMLKHKGHLSPFEHGTIYLKIPYQGCRPVFSNYKYINEAIDKDYNYITTNYRFILEEGLIEYLQYICEPTEFHFKRYSFHITCSRAIANELVRHRVFSFIQESTRYCNYSKNKFNNEITFIKPHWVQKIYEPHVCSIDVNNPNYVWQQSLELAEHDYFVLLDKGIKPQDARGILPHDLKTELIMTGLEEDWERFLEMRTSQAAHPDMRIIANMIKDKLYSNETN